MATELLARKFGSNVSEGGAALFTFDASAYYRLLEDDEGEALNAGAASDCRPAAAPELGEALRRLILALYDKGLSKGGHSVDYKATPASLSSPLTKRRPCPAQGHPSGSPVGQVPRPHAGAAAGGRLKLGQKRR